MNDDKNKMQPSQGEDATDKKNEEQQLHVKNPFNKNDDKKITQQDVENEQQFKEAQTERD